MFLNEFGTTRDEDGDKGIMHAVTIPKKKLADMERDADVWRNLFLWVWDLGK